MRHNITDDLTRSLTIPCTAVLTPATAEDHAFYPATATTRGPKLTEHQADFAVTLARLIEYAHTLPGIYTVGELYRPPETALAYERLGLGAYPSAHTLRLAADLIWHYEDRYQRGGDGYELLGAWWREAHPAARWGGTFKRPDPGHFSFAWYHVA
jgi:hypothetical protein